MDTELKFEVQKLGPQVQEEVRKKIIRKMQKSGKHHKIVKGIGLIRNSRDIFLPHAKHFNINTLTIM